MKRKQKIKLWINGQHSYTKQNKNSSHEKQEHTSNDSDAYALSEQAAASEGSQKEHELPVFNRAYKPESYRRKNGLFRYFNLKSVVFTTISAVVIGLGLGFFMLVVMGGLSDDDTNSDISAPSDSSKNVSGGAADEENDQEGVSSTVKSMNAFVLQGGVFSEADNAERIAKTFRQAGFTPVTWRENGQVYLFVGIADTKEQGQALAASIDVLDVFVKEWKTDSLQIDTDSSTLEWVETVQNQWEKTVQATAHKQKIDHSAWEEIVQSYPAEDTRFLALFEEVENAVTAMTSASFQQQQGFLLNIWRAFTLVE